MVLFLMERQTRPRAAGVGMLEDIVVGMLGNVLSNVLSTTARQLGLARRAAGERRHHADLELATYFNTYTFAENAESGLGRRLAAAISDVEVDAVTERLASDRCHAVLHELLAARLTDAPEQQLDRLRSSFSRALWPLGDLDRDAAKEVADAAFDYFDEKLCEVVGRLEGALPDAAGRLRNRAIGHRIIAILDAIERHEAAFDDDGDPAADQTFLERYRQHLVEDFGMLAPPDLQQRRRVPIEDLYVPPNIAPIPSGDLAWMEPQIPPQPLLTEFAAGIDRTVLLGDPGAGKTTAARALTHAYALKTIPFLVTLRNFAADGTISRSVAEHIEHVMNISYQCVPPRGWVRRQLLDGAALVIFDGLDELVDTSRRAEISSVIEHFCVEYPLVRVLVTSRFVGYDEARLDERDFVKLRIDRFDDEQVDEYAHKWFASDSTLTADQAAKDAAAFVTESRSVPDLRSNPLMLSLMCVLYRGEGYIPRHRAQVYRSCADLLFHRWDASRHIYMGLSLSQAQVQRLLRALAYWLLTREDSSATATRRQLVAKTTELLLARDMEQAEVAAEEFVAFCHGRGWIFVDVGTTAAGEPLYAFAHRTFMEYFAATHLSTHAETPEALARTLMPHLVRGEWDIISQLAIAMKDEAIEGGGQRTLQALLKDRRYKSDAARSMFLLTAVSCLDSVDLTLEFVKAVTRRALDYILNPQVDSSARDEMLTWSRLNVRQWRDLVAAETKVRAESLISSDDPHVRAVGFYLAAWNAVSMKSKVDVNRAFWSDWARSNAEGWRNAIERDSVDELPILHLAIDQGLLSIREVLTQPDGMMRLNASFRNPLIGFYQGSRLDWSGYSVRVDPTGRDAALGECMDLGAHLLAENVQPPFTGFPSWVVDVSDGFAGAELPSGETVAEPVYLAVAVVTAIAIESRMRSDPSSVISASVATDSKGWLSALVPYILARLDMTETAHTPLAPLPMREDYQRLFRAWANHEVDFAQA
jgi:adenylate kinase family enzyme